MRKHRVTPSKFNLAKRLIKQSIKAEGGKLSDYTPAQINTAARELCQELTLRQLKGRE